MLPGVNALIRVHCELHPSARPSRVEDVGPGALTIATPVDETGRRLRGERGARELTTARIVLEPGASAAWRRDDEEGVLVLLQGAGTYAWPLAATNPVSKPLLAICAVAAEASRPESSTETSSSAVGNVYSTSSGIPISCPAATSV